MTTSGTLNEATQVNASQIRYTWALLKADDNNSSTAGEEIYFGHDSAADFDFIPPGGVYVVDAKGARNLDFQNLWIKSAAASQALRIQYLEP